MTTTAQFAVILAVGSIGGNPIASLGLWVALVASFALGHWVRGEEAEGG